MLVSCRECVNFITYTGGDGGSGRRVILSLPEICPEDASCTPDSLEIPVPTYGVLGGLQLVNLQLVWQVQRGDTVLCTRSRPLTLQFRLTCPEPPLTLPYTSVIQLGAPPCDSCPPRICPGAPIPLHIAGSFPDGCYRFRGLKLLPTLLTNGIPDSPRVLLHVDHHTGGICTMEAPPWSVDTVLAGLPPGNHLLTVWMAVRDYSDSTTADTSVFVTMRVFTVQDSCAVPPPPDPLPFVTRVRIGPPPPCADCPPRICPAKPIPLLVSGALPSTCYRFRGIELLPSPIVGPRQEPPVVRIIVAENDCMDWACADVLVPWTANALLPSLLPGSYGLMVQLDVVSMCDSTQVNARYRATQSFTVLDSCAGPPVGPCLMADWAHPGLACDDFIAPGGVAKSVMTVTSPTRLAGLQGRLSLYPPGLRISHLEPVGPAQGMHIAWVPKENGAEFVLFAEAGAPIGGVRCETGARCQQPILAVSLVPDTDGVLPPVTHLSVGDLLGSDSLGNAVPQCQIMTLVVVESRICAGPSCDFNLDGQLDVRDLVSMVRCVLGTGACPDTSLARLDCNGDGRANVDDVMCCARVILHGGQRDTVGGRPEPNVAIEIGEAAWEANGLRVPLRVRAADRVGAARLALALPLDRYEVTGVETGAGAGQWLELHEAVDGRLVLGLIGLGPDLPAEEPMTLDVTLHLSLKPGQTAGGEIGLADLQLSGRDGVTLEVATPPAPVPLPMPGALVLSAARPNPFTHETRFALHLDRASDVELAVHDLSGRRVATLYRGALGAGPHEFAWRGVRSDGSAAANGIYFLQARVGGERLTRKVIFLRGN